MDIKAIRLNNIDLLEQYVDFLTYIRSKQNKSSFNLKRLLSIVLDTDLDKIFINSYGQCLLVYSTRQEKKDIEIKYKKLIKILSKKDFKMEIDDKDPFLDCIIKEQDLATSWSYSYKRLGSNGGYHGDE